MLKQADLQAAYEYGVKQAYYDLQKNAAELYGRDPAPWEQGGGANQSQRLPPDAAPHPAMEMPAPERGLGQMSAEDFIAAAKAKGIDLVDRAKGVGGGLLDEARHLPNGRQIMAGADNVANRFIGHMGRHPAAYGLGAAGIGAAGLTGLGLGIGNAVHNSND
jgi:hypothetical protein